MRRAGDDRALGAAVEIDTPLVAQRDRRQRVNAKARDADNFALAVITTFSVAIVVLTTGAILYFSGVLELIKFR
jgi:hypothetical protein